MAAAVVTSTFLVLICLETMLLLCLTTTGSSHSFSIHWNTTNRIFRIDNTDHIIDVNKGNNSQFEYDQVDIICPSYSPSSSSGVAERDTEKYIIYNVSREEYDTCRITNPTPRIIAVCDKPYKYLYFTITFRPFTPQPGGLEFIPGHDYYFISTSSMSDLYRRVGGSCTSHNMKVVFKVCCSPSTQQQRINNTISPINAMGGGSSVNWPTRPGPGPGPGAWPPVMWSTPATTRKPPTKKTNEYHYDKQPNEVIKNQEPYSSSSGMSRHEHITVIVTAAIVVLIMTTCLRPWR